MSNLERFVEMCKCRFEREFKDEAQGRGVRLGEISPLWVKAMAAVGGHISHTPGI